MFYSIVSHVLCVSIGRSVTQDSDSKCLLFVCWLVYFRGQQEHVYVVRVGPVVLQESDSTRTVCQYWPQCYTGQ